MAAWYATSDQNPPQVFTPSRLLLRLLDSGERCDYAVAFALGAWPVLLASLIAADQTIGDYVGYWESHVLPWPVGLPSHETTDTPIGTPSSNRGTG